MFRKNKKTAGGWDHQWQEDYWNRQQAEKKQLEASRLQNFSWLHPKPGIRPVQSHPRFAGRTELPIQGPPKFVTGVQRVLFTAQRECPWRYQEALEHLPQAVWADGLLDAGRADGYFRVDADNFLGGEHLLTNTFWHEVGHNVELFYTGATAEPGAEAYEAVVKAELFARGPIGYGDDRSIPPQQSHQEEWNRLAVEYGEQRLAQWRGMSFAVGTLRFIIDPPRPVAPAPPLIIATPPPIVVQPPNPPPGPKLYKDEDYPVKIGVASGGQGEIAVRIPGDSRRQGTYIIGKNGTGKSNLIEQMILQDAQRECRVILLDPHGELVDRVLERLPTSALNTATIYDFGDMTIAPALNLYDCPQPDDPFAVARSANRSVEVFKKIWGNDGWGPRMEDLLRMIGHTMAVNYGTLADVPALLTSPAYREGLLERVKDDIILTYWRYEYSDSIIGPVMNKVRTFVTDPLMRHILGRRWAVSWTTMLEKPGVTVIKLPLGRLGESAVSLLGSTIVGNVLTAALGREKIPPLQRLPLFLYADEFQRFSTPDFGTLLQEARKYRVGTVLAHQMRSQLDAGARSAVLGAANLLAFGVTGEDANELSRELSTNSIGVYEERRSDIVTTLNQLPRYKARVKVSTSEGNKEYVLATSAPVSPRNDRRTIAKRLDYQAEDLKETEEEVAYNLDSLGDLPVLRQVAPPEPKQQKAPRPQAPKTVAEEPVEPAKRPARREAI